MRDNQQWGEFDYTISRGVQRHDNTEAAALRRELAEARGHIAVVLARVAYLEEVMLRPMPDYKIPVPGDLA
jgi:hypothetical protein